MTEIALPLSPLNEAIISFLAPLLMAAGILDGRLAAIEAMAAYKAGGRGQAVTVARVVGFAFASLDSLRLSAAASVSLSMKLKLRGNANALNRSTVHNTAELEIPHRDAEQTARALPEQDDRAAQAATLASLEQVQGMVRQAGDPPPAESAGDRYRRLAWAKAMTGVAAECASDLEKLPPAQRRAQMIRIGVLTDTARGLATPGTVPGTTGKAVPELSAMLGHGKPTTPIPPFHMIRAHKSPAKSDLLSSTALGTLIGL
jgi:hypothetical protein